MTIVDCLEFSRALLGMEGDLVLVKDGKRLTGGPTLNDAGIKNGDLLVVMKLSTASAPSPAPAAAGGLDFSNLE